ncbi:hypothetical protein BO86DRAFT_405476 [Aspergillus japonicus CBS 114.51]|nr:hypothetical protein BO86DRAFT_405476 [Aspergillus japonicus CBS 114.51]RAH87458.1 hypothetical protein BO86DRAFT_405476 [Aspergillus japonicus CBS 114.51]
MVLQGSQSTPSPSLQLTHRNALTQIHHLLAYLSTFPFPSLPLPHSLTPAALLRALTLANPALSAQLFEESNLTHASRFPAGDVPGSGDGAGLRTSAFRTAQWGMVLAETVAFEALALRKTYTTTSEKNETAETLAADRDSDEDLTVVLIAGRCTQSGQRAVFGFPLPWAGMAGAAASCLWFQLSPVQDGFRGGFI